MPNSDRPRPARASFLPFALPSIGDEEIAAVAEVLRSGWLTSGPQVRSFEAAFAAFVGAEHAVALNSCTAALHLALEALGVGPGDEVVTSPFTFTATAEVIAYLGATPIFADIDPATGNLDPAAAAAAVTPRTVAIVPVHLGGLAAPLGALRAVAARRGLALVDDAAHALPATCDGRMVGAGADATAFSFYATKTITTGEGGMLTTNDGRIAERVRLMSLHGISKDGWKRYAQHGSWHYEVRELGYKYNLTDIAAALGLAQLRRCDALAERRAAIAAAYDEAFAGLAALELPPRPAPGDRHAWHLYQIRLDLGRLPIDRATFVRALAEQNIGASVHFIPLHTQPAYRERYGYQPEDFPRAMALYERVVSLPIYPAMSDDDVRDVIEAVQSVALRTED